MQVHTLSFLFYKELPMHRHFGDFVFINLSTATITREPCPESVITSFLGGRGVGTYILLKFLGQDVQPFDPENILVFATGLLTGTEMIAASRLHVCARSPLTGFIGTSNGGGDIAYELCRCGIGALIISGKSKSPVYLHITEKGISIKDASQVWGLNTSETYHMIRQLIPHKTAKVLTIGPAGEKLCAFASIMLGIGHFAGRTGLGAVMGSKRLKAIAVRASTPLQESQNPLVQRVVKEYFDNAKASPCYRQYSTIGSTYSTLWLDHEGAGTVRNCQDVVFEGIKEASWAAQADIVVKTKGCYKCPFRCKADVRIDQGRHQGVIMERPDFEPMVTLGSKCDNSDGREIVYLHNLCNAYGMDSVEAGNLIAFAIDLFERGILTPDDTELELRWGNVLAMEQLLTQIVLRDSWLGDTLARGITEAVKIIGGESGRYAFAVKGLTMTAMDPRGFKATALGYAVSARGADYTHVYAKPEYSITPDVAWRMYGTEKAADRLSEEGKALMVYKSIRSTALIDAIGLCKIPQISFLLDSKLEIIATLLKGILDIALTPEELFTIGERIVNAERLLNQRFGATGQDDRLPEKFLHEPIPHGVSKGSVVKLEPMLQEYYALMGWDETGMIPQEKLVELGLEELQDKNSYDHDLRIIPVIYRRRQDEYDPCEKISRGTIGISDLSTNARDPRGVSGGPRRRWDSCSS
jgi:aldehyde:ferredoxin oxidoreductase